MRYSPLNCSPNPSKLITRLALIRRSPIVLPEPVRRLFSRGNNSVRIFCGACANPVGFIEIEFCLDGLTLVAKPGEIDKSNAARSKSHATPIVNDILRLATQTRIDTPASPTVVNLGVKFISDEPHFRVSEGDS